MVWNMSRMKLTPPNSSNTQPALKLSLWTQSPPSTQNPPCAASRFSHRSWSLHLHNHWWHKSCFVLAASEILHNHYQHLPTVDTHMCVQHLSPFSARSGKDRQRHSREAMTDDWWLTSDHPPSKPPRWSLPEATCVSLGQPRPRQSLQCLHVPVVTGGQRGRREHEKQGRESKKFRSLDHLKQTFDRSTRVWNLLLQSQAPRWQASQPGRRARSTMCTVPFASGLINTLKSTRSKLK